MRYRWIVRIAGIALVALIVIAGFGQAVLFGSWRGFGRHYHWRRGMRERWERMSPEERVAFRQAMEHRCARRTAPATTVQQQDQ